MDLTEEDLDMMINWDTSSLGLFEEQPQETAMNNSDSSSSGQSGFQHHEPTAIQTPPLQTVPSRVLTAADFDMMINLGSSLLGQIEFEPHIQIPSLETGTSRASTQASLTNLSGPIEPTGSQLMGMADSSFSSIGRLEPLLPGAIVVRMPRIHTRHVLTEADFAGINVSAILSLGSRLRRRRYDGLQEDKISKYLKIITNNNIVDEKTVCAICLDNFCGKDMQVAIVDGCGHKFHACCLKSKEESIPVENLKVQSSREIRSEDQNETGQVYLHPVKGDLQDPSASHKTLDLASSLEVGPTTSNSAKNNRLPPLENDCKWWLVKYISDATDTYKGHSFRQDLFKMLKDLNPGFIRFPGGCFVEGEWLRNAFRWEKTIGPWEERPGHFVDVWHYWTDDGFGHLEFLQLAEDLCAAPIWVFCNGVSHNDQVDTSNIAPFLQSGLGNCCKYVQETTFRAADFVIGAVPLLTNLLQYPDAKVLDVEFAAHVHADECSFSLCFLQYNCVFNGRSDPCGAAHIAIGDVGNIEGLAPRYKKSQPEWSVFQEASFGHAELRIVNLTHAYWSWHRNVDDEPVKSENLMSLRAYVFESGVYSLVYDYVPIGSLEDVMKRVTENQLKLKRLHYNLKLSNLIMDSEFEPRYTDKSDIYSFGMILGVVLTGMDPNDTSFSNMEECLSKNVNSRSTKQEYPESKRPQESHLKDE
ncbi:alpha-L-arabinofuranosidase, partial [Striga asiatica]